MTEEMPRRLPAHVYRETTRHGRIVTYFRRGKGKRVRLPNFGEADFDAAYLAAVVDTSPAPRRQAKSGTLAWLIERYRETSAWRDLSMATRRQRENIFRAVLAKSGMEPFTEIDRASVVAGRDKRATTPAQARHFLDAVRGLFRWAVKAEYVETDPTAGVEDPKRQNSDGHPPWTEDDVAAYERHWPAGSRERLWMHVIRYTGLRRGDAVRLGRQHFKDGLITLKTEKTGITVYIPIALELEAAIAAGQTGDLALIVGRTGQPLAKESFGNAFADACRAAGLPPGKSAHGLRKLAASEAAERGLTVAELEAMFGWTGGRMASFYTRAADRKRLARSAAEKMANAKRPHPTGENPAPKKTLDGTSG